MALKPNDLIEEFYKTLEGTKHEHIDLAQCREICTAPWKFLRHMMRSDEIPPVRFMYFGLFEVRKNRAKHSLKTLEKRWVEGRVSPEDYDKYKSLLTNYLNEDSGLDTLPSGQPKVLFVEQPQEPDKKTPERTDNLPHQLDEGKLLW